MSNLALLAVTAGLFWYTARLLLRPRQPDEPPPEPPAGPVRLWSRAEPEDWA